MRKRGTDYKRLRERARRLIANDDRLLSELAGMREAKRISLEIASRRIGITEAELEAIDGGTKDPTMGELRRYAHAVGAVIEHRVTDDEAEVVTDYSEPVVVTHECGQIEISSVRHDPSFGPIAQINMMGVRAQTKTLQVETTLV
ncbi:helix-turn-helix domain-containing protein [Bifidobacterium breve]|uniref:helix-turn-helix domain-containing protein n=1 Tax=Bifidobacterium breve TaxID=1685 RepID=UPI00080BA22B|nr:helix-turn-helix transcriptional regulator [Bifidobacterium breve]AZI16062.1 XRE family transcriptional regulator [Bifidobacterium breve]